MGRIAVDVKIQKIIWKPLESICCAREKFFVKFLVVKKLLGIGTSYSILLHLIIYNDIVIVKIDKLYNKTEQGIVQDAKDKLR